jgi:GNAT superfamily N-acetyltransferase
MTGDTVSIRPAAVEDLEQLWPLVQDFAFSYEPERSAFERSFSDLLGRSDTLVLVAVENASAMVGYLLGSYHETLFANGPVAWVEELMVGESSRHRGVASKLMSAAEEWARTIPTAYIALASRRAGDFYLRIGYEASATYFRKSFVPPKTMS